RARRAPAAVNGDRDGWVAVRGLELRHRAQGQAGVLGAVPPGSIPRPARQPLSVRAVRRDDAAGEEAQLTVGGGANSTHKVNHHYRAISVVRGGARRFTRSSPSKGGWVAPPLPRFPFLRIFRFFSSRF